MRRLGGAEREFDKWVRDEEEEREVLLLLGKVIAAG